MHFTSVRKLPGGGTVGDYIRGGGVGENKEKGGPISGVYSESELK